MKGRSSHDGESYGWTKGEVRGSMVKNDIYTVPDSSEVTSDSGPFGEGSSNAGTEEEAPKQHSVFTIFTIWNTMMGTSILAMPWTLQQAGFGLGIFLILFVAGIACYTAYLANKTTDDIKLIKNLPANTYLDISDAAEFHFGKAGRIIALIFSQVSLIGASIVYYVLLSNFLYFTGEYIYMSVHKLPQKVFPLVDKTGRNFTDVICASSVNQAESGIPSTDVFSKIWVMDRTVPAWLLIILFPLISIKSPTILGKFTSLATVSVLYLFILLGIKGYYWGVNMDNTILAEPVPQARNLFFSLTGTCSLAFYIHNALQTILRTQKKPENNSRDIIIAFSFATVTYVLVGIVFFIIFPVSKLCIADNLLNNLSTDVPVFIARLFLLIQMTTIYPMLVYLIRAQIMHAIFKKVYPSWKHVIVLHVIIVGLGLLFAIVYPSIGTIIRFIGAISGLVFIFTIPPVLTLLNMRMLRGSPQVETDPLEYPESNSTIINDKLLFSNAASVDRTNVTTDWVDRRSKVIFIVLCVFYSFVILIGLVNFIGQFVLLGL